MVLTRLTCVIVVSSMCTVLRGDPSPDRASGDIRWPADLAASQPSSDRSARRLPAVGDQSDGDVDVVHFRGNSAPDAVPAPGQSAAGRPPSDPAAQTTRDSQPVPPSASGQPWWNDEAHAANPLTQTDAGDSAEPTAPGELLASARILAIVGTETILAGDLLGRANELLQPYANQLSAEQLEEQRWLLVRQMLSGAIETKLVYLDFLRTIPREHLATIQDNVYKQFDETRLPELIQQAKVNSLIELDTRLRTVGSSVDKLRRTFLEQVAAREMIRRQTQDLDDVTHDQLLDYYHQHADEFWVPRRARWEQLMTRYASSSSREEAWARLRDMGNEVLGGAPLEAVARRASDGPTASRGGSYDWTTQGSLVSEVLDQAIFSLPTGKLSRILEDDQGFHIVRVLEREGGFYVPFEQAQVEIRQKIRDARRRDRVEQYLERLKQGTYVWNCFEHEGEARN